MDYEHALQLVRERCETQGANPEYERGQIELLADLFPHAHLRTGLRVQEIARDLWRRT